MSPSEVKMSDDRPSSVVLTCRVGPVMKIGRKRGADHAQQMNDHDEITTFWIFT